MATVEILLNNGEPHPDFVLLQTNLPAGKVRKILFKVELNRSENVSFVYYPSIFNPKKVDALAWQKKLAVYLRPLADRRISIRIASDGTILEEVRLKAEPRKGKR